VSSILKTTSHYLGCISVHVWLSVVCVELVNDDSRCAVFILTATWILVKCLAVASTHAHVPSMGAKVNDTAFDQDCHHWQFSKG
jgi:hypothetical protein